MNAQEQAEGSEWAYEEHGQKLGCASHGVHLEVSALGAAYGPIRIEPGTVGF